MTAENQIENVTTTSPAAQYPRCLTVLTAKEQKTFGGEWASDTKLSGLPTVRSVVNAVIKQAYELDDTQIKGDKEYLLHDEHWIHYRGEETLVLGQTYPVHGLVSVGSIETANDVADYMNKVFSADRGKYPKKDGWQAMAAHSTASIALDKNHPFFRYKETRKLDSRCCRFLVVNEMAVEGMNNRYLGIWGAAETFGSVRKGVQRIGRIMRSAAVRDGGKFFIPPASHDQAYIITHEAFESRPSASGTTISTARTISESVDFIVDMHQATADIMTLDEYVALDVSETDTGDINRASQLTRWAKYAIAVQIGQALQQGRRPQIGRLVRNFGGTSELKKSYVRAFAESALNHHPSHCHVIKDGVVADKAVDAIEDLKRGVLRIEPPEPAQVLEAERMAVQALDLEGAKAWLSKFGFGPYWLRKLTDADEAEWLESVNQMRLSWEGQFDKYELDVRQTPAARLMSMADEITKNLNVEDSAARVRELALEGAVHHLGSLGATTLDDFDEGGAFCRPEITYAFRSEPFVSQLQAWVCFILLKEKRLNDLWAVLRFERFWEEA
ncbi:MAG: hypothetical protein Q8J80_03250 [Gallionella sp.]|nr:hypothetical protein [Gallionella sp.]